MSTGDDSDARDGDDEQRPSLGDSPFGAFGFPSMGALSGLGELLGEARSQLEQASAEAADVSVVGRAGGGAVEVEITGNLEVLSVRIAPEVVDPDEVSFLEDLVLAAVRDALSEAVEVREQAASAFLPTGVDLGAMVSGLFGGALGSSESGLGSLLGGLPDLGTLMDGLLGSAPDDDDEEEAYGASDEPS